ncbi:hypothetical protein B0T10DRAFT_468008 [Thelonectria olida]|uniref:Uncharacterized protein n=1 Tax=Thelonectria olida TaxID=1576542 RepID=A0A9P8VP42_9HYPO|nr:hypothetical protein B0T10DRAFT_468008 [Thelonectria olida]
MAQETVDIGAEHAESLARSFASSSFILGNPRNSVSQSLAVASEKDCHELSLREVSALPEREPLTSTTTTSVKGQMTLMSLKDSSQTDSGRQNNAWIERTVQTAISDILPDDEKLGAEMHTPTVQWPRQQKCGCANPS